MLESGVSLPSVEGVVHALTCARRPVQIFLPGRQADLAKIRHELVEPLTTALFGPWQGFAVTVALHEALMNSVTYGEQQPVQLELVPSRLGRRPVLTFTVTDANRASILEIDEAQERYPQGHELLVHRGLMLLRDFSEEHDLQGVMTFRDAARGVNVCTFSAIMAAVSQCHHPFAIARRQRDFIRQRQSLTA
ncbi:hypothetical protein HY523_02525 [Candidatus Berkelbacteria bacterium]|nr:hypothetical protein [Candidatus Berkelbacteria bacterium]